MARPSLFFFQYNSITGALDTNKSDERFFKKIQIPEEEEEEEEELGN